MRYFRDVLLIISFFIVFSTNAQTIKSLNSENRILENRKNQLFEQIRNLRNEIDSLNEVINSNNSQIINFKEAKLSKKIIKVTSKKAINVYDVRSIARGKIIFTIPKKETVELLDYMEEFWLLKYEDRTGWVFYPTFSENPLANEFKEELVYRNKKINDAKEKEKKQLIKKSRLEDLKQKYGSYASYIFDNKVKIGMNKAMVIESIGNPKSKNITTGSYGISEQWIYNNKYLYFENGKLTTIQTFN